MMLKILWKFLTSTGTEGFPIWSFQKICRIATGAKQLMTPITGLTLFSKTLEGKYLAEIGHLLNCLACKDLDQELMVSNRAL